MIFFFAFLHIRSFFYYIVANGAAGGGGGKKRPAWDLKGRLEDMEAKLERQTSNRSSLISQMEEQNQRIMSLESVNNQLSGTVSMKENIVTQASQEIDDLKRKLRYIYRKNHAYSDMN